MRPESGARMKRRARMISIRYSAPEYGAPSGHIALNCLTPNPGLRSGPPSGKRFARLPYVDAHGRCRSNLDSVGIDRGLKTSLLFKKRPKKEPTRRPLFLVRVESLVRTGSASLPVATAMPWPIRRLSPADVSRDVRAESGQSSARRSIDGHVALITNKPSGFRVVDHNAMKI